MFGALFFAGEQMLFVALVFGFVFAARERACDGAVKNITALHFDEHFGRAADDGDVVELQVEKIRRRIDGAQLAINVERVRFCFCGEALADDDLKNIAGTDVFLALLYGLQVFGAAEIGFDVERAALGARNFSARLFGFDGLLELFARFFDGADSRVVFFAEVAFAAGVNVANDPEAMLDVIEGDDAVIEGQYSVEEADVVAQARWDALDESHHVVRKIADGAGDQRRQAGDADGPEFFHAAAQECDGIFFFPDDALAAFENARAGCVAENFFRICACESVAGDFFAAFHAFEQKGVARALGDAQVGAHGSEQIGGQNVVNRDEIALLGEALKFFEVGLDHRWLFLAELVSGADARAFTAQSFHDCAAHDRFGRALFRPQFPLRDSLREKHFDAAHGVNSLFGCDLQKLRAFGAIDEVHDDATV